MPQFGFGTYKVEPADAQQRVETALELGIRHIDTAQMYGNEKEVGKAIAASGIDRSEIFLTTKLNNNNHEPTRVRESFEESLQALAVDYVDLFLIHWPMPDSYGGDYVSTWEAMVELTEQDWLKAAGVSNFEIEHLQHIIDETGVVPQVNQIEVHPELANNELRAFNRANSIITQAWSPLARARYLDHPSLLRLAKEYDKSPAQILLRWAVQRDDVVFPKASSRERIAENMDIFSWTLGNDAMETLDSMDRGEQGRRGSHPQEMNWMPPQ